MSIEEKFDFKKFIQRIYIFKSAELVYKMWAMPENIEKWYVKSSIYHTSEGKLRGKEDEIFKDDEYEWIWMDGAKLNGMFIEADGKENLKFTFGKDVTVSIKLKQKDDRTLVELVQEQDMDEAEMKFNNYMACFPGWEFYLINLKSVCENGHDLRETRPDMDFLVNI